MINAGDGKHEHPTQALLDVFTLRRRLGSLDGAHIWIVGDVLHSRVARSDILAFSRMGAQVTVCGPPTLIPREIEALGCDADRDARRPRARPTSCTCCGCSTSGCASRSSRRCASTPRATRSTPRRLRPGQLLMHPGPVNRGVELLGRRDRLAAGADRRPGQGGRGGADGGPLRAAGRRRRRWRRWRDGDRALHAGAAPARRPAGRAADPRRARARPARPGSTSRTTSSFRDGRIAELGAPGSLAAAGRRRAIDAAGKHAVPGVRRPARASAHARARSTRRTSRPAPPPPPPAASAP